MPMSVNNKLTHAIKDRVVQNFQLNASELLISFVDGSTMKVNIVESNSPPLHEATRIRQISEDRVKLFIECEDGSVRRNDSRSGKLCDRSGQERLGRVSRISMGLVVESRSKRVIILDLSRIASALDQQSGVG
jgi:uncharacterized NAD(P)/FAD-binding protein YdhS